MADAQWEQSKLTVVMNKLRIIREITKADLFERIRRYSFLFMLLGAAWLAYTVYADFWRIRIAEQYRIALGPVRTGTLVALVTNLVFSFAGFYLVKGTIQRDRETGIGSILNTTSLNRWEYAGGKFLSNLGVLVAMVAVLILASIVMTLVQAEVFYLSHLWDVLSPFLLLTLPVLFTIAGLALLFDSIPYLDGSLGNVLYLILWASLFPIAEAYPSLDVVAFDTTIEYVQEALINAYPNANTGSYAMKITEPGQSSLSGFDWQGLPWISDIIIPRLSFIGLGIFGWILSAGFLYIVDPFSSERAVTSKESSAGKSGDDREHFQNDTVTGISFSDLAPAHAAGPILTGLKSIRTELKLLLLDRKWWWYLGVLSVNAVAFAIDDISLVLLGAWLLPLTAWSSLGGREKSFGTDQILFATPSPVKRQLPAQLFAGFLISLMTAAGPLVQFLISGNWNAVGALMSAAFFIPVLALFLGIWTSRSKTFEAVYLILWYIGPLNGIAVLDFMGITDQAVAMGTPYWFFIFGVLLLVLALFKRRHQLRTVG